MKFCVIVLIGIIVLLHLLPELIALLLAWKQPEEKSIGKMLFKNMPVIVISIFVNFVVFFVFHRFYWGYKNFAVTLLNLYTRQFYYHDLEYFAISSVICFTAAIIVGLVIKGRKRSLFVLKKNLVGAIVSCSALMIAVIFYISASAISHICINEICSNNQSTYLDDQYVTDDYIELYNSGIFVCRLDSLYLSDDGETLKKISLKEYEIGAGDYLVIKLSGDSDSFSINKSGETIYLSNKGGKVLDCINCAELREDTVYCRMPDGAVEWGIYTCTPYVSNVQAMAADIVVDVPEFSLASGFYKEAFNLQIDADQGSVIYYTLDGSIPDATSEQYTNPIYVYDRSPEKNIYRSIQNVTLDYNRYTVDETPVDKAFIITAVAINESGIASKPVTATYFVGMDSYKDKDVISLVADPEALFGDKGIYVTGKEYDDWYHSDQTADEPIPNFEGRGREWEIPASIRFMKNTETYEERVGLRIFGGSARTALLKRFSVFARKDYSGSKWIKVPLEDGKEVHSFMLREGFGNAYLPSLVEDRDISVQKAAPVSVFLNGEHWYDTYLLEKYNEEYFSQKYLVNEDNVILYKNGNLEAGREDDSILYNEIYDYLNEHDMSDEENYKNYCEIVDIQSYIDFWCFHLYVNNLDVDENKNAVLWRTRDKEENQYADGLWRWALYDLDAVEWNDAIDYGVEESAQINNFTQDTKYAGEAFNKKPMYVALKNNPDFCKQFVLTFMDLVNSNFSVEHVSRTLEQWGEDITWRDSYFEKRAGYIVPDMAEEFGLTGTLETVNLSVNDSEAGEVSLNTMSPDLKNGTWSGNYYTDYPITLNAIPKEGYRFVGWTGSVESTDQYIEVEMQEGGIQLNAIFKKAE